MAAAGGVLAVSAGAHGGGQPDADLAARINRHLKIGRVVKVEPPLQEAPVIPPSLLEAFPNADPDLFETMPLGVPIVTFEIPNNEAIEAGLVDSRGIAATGGTGETYVFYQPNDSGYGNFMKDDDTLGYGTWATQAILGNGFEAGMTISAYDFLMYNSPYSVNDAAWSAALWDGDPRAALDTVCNGGLPAPIAGTFASWGPLPQAPPGSSCEAIFGNADPECVGLYRLRATLGSKVVIPCDRVWIVVTMTQGCRSGLRIAGTNGDTDNAPAEHGFQNGREFSYACELYKTCGPNQDSYNAGTCCNSGAACDFTDTDPGNWVGAPCSFEPQDPFTSPADATFCADGTIDFLATYGNVLDEYRGYVASVYARLPCVDPPPDMVAWYTGDDCGPTDFLGNHDGTFVGTPVCTPNWKVGGGAMTFFTGTYVVVPDAPGLNFSELTIDAWIRTTANGYRPIVNKLFPGYSMALSYGHVRFDLCTTDVCIPGPETLAVVNEDGEWHHVAATLSRAGDVSWIDIYIDGEPAASAEFGDLGSINGPSNLLIGAGPSWDIPWDFFEGEMDEIEIFNRALDASEIEEIYLAGRFGKCKDEKTPLCLGQILKAPDSIETTVDYSLTAAGLAASTTPQGAIFHPEVPVYAEGTTSKSYAERFIANDPNTQVTINWWYKDDADQLQELRQIYEIGSCVADSQELGYAYEIEEVKYLKAYPETNIELSGLYAVSVCHNSTIREGDPQAEPPTNDHVTIVGNQVIVDQDSPTGYVLIRYDEYVGGPLKGFEVVNINSDRPTDVTEPQDIGRDLLPPAEEEAGNYCRAVMIQNIEQDGVKVAWQRGHETTDIYPIRPEDDRNKFVVALYKRTPFENCWPAEVKRYTTYWPSDPQLHVIDTGAANVGETPAGSLVDLRFADTANCSAEVMYQESFTPGVPDVPKPFAHITAEGQFTARKPGYSVLRVDRKLSEIAQCGDEVVFEVIASLDHLGSDPCGDLTCDPDEDCLICPIDCCDPLQAPVYDPSINPRTWFIGTQLQDDDHDLTAPTFPFGFLKAGRPYAVGIYEDTGQIIPVNVSFDAINDVPDSHLLEVWWYEKGDPNRTPGMYWPHKVRTYNCEWPTSPSEGLDEEIVIAAARRGGVGTYGTDARIYDVGTYAAGDNANATEQYNVIGYQPNDEHAVLLPDPETADGTLRVFAPRNDNPWGILKESHGYVLVQDHDPDDGLWSMGVHKVESTNSIHDFDYGGNSCASDTDTCSSGLNVDLDCRTDRDCNPVAGYKIDPLFPVNKNVELCEDDDPDDFLLTETVVVPVPPPPAGDPALDDSLWVDNKETVWAIAGPDENDVPRQSNLYLTENWPWDIGCQAWLENGPDGCCDCVPGNAGCGTDIGTETHYAYPLSFEAVWPEHEGEGCDYPDDATCAQQVFIGQAIDRSTQCGPIEILHDDADVRIIDPLHEVWVEHTSGVDFSKLPPHLFAGEIGGDLEFPDRIRYDFTDMRIYFRGIMSELDRHYLETEYPEEDYPGLPAKIDILYDTSRAQVDTTTKNVCHGGLNDGQLCPPNDCCEDGVCEEDVPEDICRPFEATVNKFVSFAHPDAEIGWETLGLQNHPLCTDTGLPVSVEVIRVDCPPYQGFIRPIVPECPLSEKMALQFSGDGAGQTEDLYYQWQYSTNYDPSNPQDADWDPYSPPLAFTDGHAVREVVIDENSDLLMVDSYWRMRYRGYVVGCPCTDGSGDCNEYQDPDDPNTWPFTGGQNTMISPWTEVQLAEGWVKRVMRALNPFDQRIENFHVDPTATYVDMIHQAGKRYLDIVALNCDAENINNVGLIELYETVMRRAKQFTIDHPTPTATPEVSQAIQMAAGKISDLYMLLGNEAFADAQDPTIGVFADQGEPSGVYDPYAMFCFENQVAGLLEEELALLRGVDDTHPVTHDADNRPIATVDNRLVWNLTSDIGQVAYANNYQVTDVAEAITLYPQGHGDAWGHYLSALKKFYDLLQHKEFKWNVTTEEVLVAGQRVSVGYMYERKFVNAAAAKARTGAAITSLTFRQLYTPDAVQQRQGFPDPDPDVTGRAWGLSDWARRAGQGAYFDWVVGNALLPPEDPEPTHEGIQKIDRTTIPELGEIAAACTEIQTVLDQADAGHNPLGLAANVVPFGLNPTEIEEGKTHFDQIFERALVSLNNAATAFDYANQNTQRLRSMQDAEERFEDLVEERELDYKSRLIEIFGRPYQEDIGFGGAYPANYDGADIFHFAYVEPSNIIAVDNATATTTISVTFEKPDFTALGSVGQELDPEVDDWTVEFNVSTDGLGLIKPAGWGKRQVPGAIQFTRGEIMQTIGRYQLALENYAALVDKINDQVDIVADLFDLNRNVLTLMLENRAEEIEVRWLIYDAQRRELRNRRFARIATLLSNISYAAPTSFTDIGAVARALALPAVHIANQGFLLSAERRSLDGLQHQQSLAALSRSEQITIKQLQDAYQEAQQVMGLKQLILSLSPARLELYGLEETIMQNSGRYHAAISGGMLALEQFAAFRQRTADQVSQYRYRDMAFRVFRNEALQKYRSQFDLAARYVYLTAQAYDYETNLLGNDPMGGQRFKTEIVKERHLGVINGGVPYVGNGLAGKLAQMGANFDVLRSELGFNSKDEFERTFSLRWELFRIENAVASDLAWRCLLDPDPIECQGQTLPPNPPFKVPDLNSWAIYREYCEPLRQDEDPTVRQPEPALVIPFSTKLLSGSNLFGKTTRGDETLPSDRYAVKIHSVGIRFAQSYASPPLNKQVNVYLVPTGIDRLRVPTDGTVRDWQVLDETLPMPFPITQDDLRRPNWLAWDSLVGGSAAMTNRRRIPTIAACPTTDEECDMSQKLAGRSLWNTQWYLIIPGSQLMADSRYPDDPEVRRDWLDWFMSGAYGTGVRDIQLIIKAYGYAGTSQD